MCLAAPVPDLRGRAAPDPNVADLVQRRAPASGPQVSQPSSIPCATINRGGLLWRVHYTLPTAPGVPRCHLQHESGRQCLGQCGDGEFLLLAEDRTYGREDVPYKSPGPGRCV